MKPLQYLTLIGGLAILAAAISFIFQLPIATGIWPWKDGRLSYMFIGSILAAVSAAALWIGWTGELGEFPAGSLNILVIAVTTAIYFFQLALRDGRSNLIPFGVASLLIAIISGAAFVWSRGLPRRDSMPTPLLVRISFGIFIAALLLAGGALILKTPVFPWALNPDSSVIFGCIFLGDAFYFLYGLLYPRWHNALGQLLSFLTYDHTAVLLYSGAIAVYYLFINSKTRFGS